MAVDQAADYLENGETGLEEKQSIDCVLITADNAAELDNFMMTS